jgi:hypothetical protein
MTDGMSSTKTLQKNTTMATKKPRGLRAGNIAITTTAFFAGIMLAASVSSPTPYTRWIDDSYGKSSEKAIELKGKVADIVKTVKEEEKNLLQVITLAKAKGFKGMIINGDSIGLTHIEYDVTRTLSDYPASVVFRLEKAEIAKIRKFLMEKRNLLGIKKTEIGERAYYPI